MIKNRLIKLFLAKLIILFIQFMPVYLEAQTLKPLKIAKNGKYFVTETGKPFLWIGGTAWEMIHRLNRDEVKLYLKNRAEKGFNVIQTVVLAELDGLNTPNAYGQKPLIGNNPEQLNPEYFKHVEFVIKQARKMNLYVALLPTWGDKINKKWGTGPVIFNENNAEKFGQLIAERFRKYDNIIWVLGGDRIPENETHFAIYQAMAKGIRSIDSLKLMTYHPSGAKTASDYFSHSWLTFDMFQSGHSRNTKEYNYVIKALDKNSQRPIVNGEARYENIPDRFWENETHTWLNDADVRVSAYWSIIAGAAGYTYGCNDIWQMYDNTRLPGISSRTDWQVALNLPGSMQMLYLKQFFESFAWFEMEYNTDLVLNKNPKDEAYIVAAQGKNHDFIVAYTPQGRKISVDLSFWDNKKIKAYWFNPRSGTKTPIRNINTREVQTFKPWAQGVGSDFILLLEVD